MKWTTAGSRGNNPNESISCPLCAVSGHDPWATENGYDCVRCRSCGLLYVNPRPSIDKIGQAITHGVHSLDGGEQLNVHAHSKPNKVSASKRLIQGLLGQALHTSGPVSWLDIGAGYGEMVEALLSIAPDGSRIEGIEPMQFKANYAQSRGLPIRSVSLHEVDDRYDFVLLMDVFSHIPDFHAFLGDVKKVLKKKGVIIMKTGNAADIGHRRNFPGPLTLPDHLVFAGENHIVRFLDDAGFSIVSISKKRIDGFFYSTKNFVKWIMGKPVYLSLPYRSPTRTLLVCAKLK